MAVRKITGVLAVMSFAIVLIVGAHYTYAEVPAGAWVAEWLGQTRNPYDRLGHLMQGVVPALMVTSTLLRSW